MGAGQSFQWAVSYPDMVERCIPFCGAARTYINSFENMEFPLTSMLTPRAHHNITFLRSLIMAIQLDPRFQQGEYEPEKQPQAGKEVFSAIYSGWGNFIPLHSDSHHLY